jgi:hypothetical protein
MRTISGLSSDTDRDLRQRRNTASERGGDDDSMLPGLFHMPTILPTKSAIRVRWAGATANERIGLGVAMVMMMMTAILRGINGSGTATASSIDDVMMLMLMLAATSRQASRDGPAGRGSLPAEATTNELIARGARPTGRLAGAVASAGNIATFVVITSHVALRRGFSTTHAKTLPTAAASEAGANSAGRATHRDVRRSYRNVLAPMRDKLGPAA